MIDVRFSQIANFQPKQLEAQKVLENCKYLLYGGAAGGGKSYFLRWIALRILMKLFAIYGTKGIRVGLFCEDYPALKERHLSKVQFEFPDWLGTLNRSEHEFTLKPEFGSGVVAFRNLDDPSKYLSSEFAAILVDELTKNTRETFDFLNMRLRWPGISDVKFLGATNPGSVGHGWVKKLWIDRDFSDENYNPEDFKFVQSLFTDNRFIDPNYGKQLDALPENMKRAYKDGDWDLFVGQFFTEFRKKIHVTEPFEIPKSWKKIRCLDYGFKAPSCCLWLAVDYDGNVYVYRELYQAGLNYHELARKIGEMTPNEEEIDYTAADTEMFAKTRDTGEYGHDIMADEGIPITQANKERIPGWNLLRRQLKNQSLYFFETCRNTVRTLPSLVHDETKIEDLDTDGEDHAADALRYGLMSIPEKPVKKDSTIPAPVYQNDPDAPWNKPIKKGTANIYSLTSR